MVGRALARYDDQHLAARGATNFIINYRNAPPEAQAKLEAIWVEAGLGDLPPDPEDDKGSE